MSSVKELLQFDFKADAFARRSLQPIAIPSEQLATLKGIAKMHDGKGSGQPDQESLRQIYHLFRDTPLSRLPTEFESLRRIRQLTWALTYSENGLSRIVDTPQLREALQLIESRFRISASLGVFDALIKAWDAPNADMLRAFLKIT